MTPGAIEPHAEGAGRVSKSESFALTETKRSLALGLGAMLPERVQSDL